MDGQHAVLGAESVEQDASRPKMTRQPSSPNKAGTCGYMT